LLGSQHLAGRIEAIAKSLDLPLIASDDFAHAHGRALKSLADINCAASKRRMNYSRRRSITGEQSFSVGNWVSSSNCEVVVVSARFEIVDSGATRTSAPLCIHRQFHIIHRQFHIVHSANDDRSVTLCSKLLDGSPKTQRTYAPAMSVAFFSLVYPRRLDGRPQYAQSCAARTRRQQYRLVRSPFFPKLKASYLIKRESDCGL
jgi:hypothetical protein